MRYDVAVGIRDFQWIETGDEPGRPYNMGPRTARLDPDEVLPSVISPTSQHADHPSKQPRSARTPTRCWQVDHPSPDAHVRRPFPASAMLLQGMTLILASVTLSKMAAVVE